MVLPRGYADKFNEQVASLPESERVLWKYHTVRKGDTLGGSQEVRDDSQPAYPANNISVKSALRAGQSLVIPVSGVNPLAAQTASGVTPPAGGIYVRRGDTLFRIATRFDITVAQLQGWNRLSSTQIAVGKKLVVAGRLKPPQQQ